jgi:hypothetical protein
MRHASRNGFISFDGCRHGCSGDHADTELTADSTIGNLRRPVRGEELADAVALEPLT